MSKKGVSKISGNAKPQAGEKAVYSVDSCYSGTPEEKRNLQNVTWELFKKRKNGKFTKANIIKKGDNTFTFGESVVGDTFKLFGYLYHPEGPGLIITPRRAEIPKIEKIELLHVDNTVAKKYSVNDIVRCKATCTNMLLKKVIFRLWEDDANGTYTKETSESAGIHDYKINNDTKQKTKDVIAKEKFDIVTPKLKGERKYAKLDTIKNALTGSTPFKAGTIIKFETYKLGPEFKRIASAPLEDKVYLVASSYLLEGKNAKILIKEKDGLINGSADAVFPSLELTEAQMEQSEPLKESERTEKTEFSGTIKKVNTKNDKGEETESEMLIVPIQLRPKSDDDLKIWKEKLAKGKQDGTHTYKANNPFTIENEQEKNQIAGTITSRSNKELGSTHKIFKEDVLKSLSADGKTVYDQVKDIPKYKKEPELLYLHVTAQGTTQHDEKFLNKEGVYFEIGGGCQRCIDVITLEQIEALFGVHSESTEFRKEVVKFLNLYIDQRRNTDKEIHINTCLRKAHFFAQVGAETSGINTGWMVETDVNPYKADNITTSLFGERATKLRNRGQLEEFCAERPQIKLLNFLYARENDFGNGNGDEASGDGYLYRGRGLKQLTGRGNYKNASHKLKEIFPEEYLDLEADPDKVKEAKYAVLSAIAYWENNEVWKVADEIKVSNEENIKRIRSVVSSPFLVNFKSRIFS